MADGPNKDIPQPVSAEVVLRDTATRYKRLQDEAHKALRVHKNTVEYQEKLRASGQLIVDLTQVLGSDLVDKSGLLERDQHELGFFSSNASDALESGNMFALGTLLIPMGSRVGDPNDLERLIERVYPSTPELEE
jgi:hypothetical protein